MNWIRRERRLAIYLRDALACVWCGDGVEDGVVLTLDHVRPNANGGCNSNRNLVTACRGCNSARGTRSVPAFAKAVAGHAASAVERRVRNALRRRVDVAAARDMLGRRENINFGETVRTATNPA